MFCGSGNNNRFCDQDDNKNGESRKSTNSGVIIIKRFKVMKREMLSSKNIVQISCGDFNSTVLTSEGYVLSWGGSASLPKTKDPNTNTLFYDDVTYNSIGSNRNSIVNRNSSSNSR